MDEEQQTSDDDTRVVTWMPVVENPPAQYPQQHARAGAAVAVGVIVVIPLLIIMLVVIHPWNFASSSDSSTGLDNSGNSGFGGGYVEQTTDPVSQETMGLAPNDAGDNDSSTQTTTSEDPAAEAAAITNILQQAQSDRQSVVDAVNDALTCGSNLAGDAQALQTAQTDRQQLAQNAAASPVDGLDGASAIPGELSTALSDSATADGDFAQWVGDLENSCSSGSVTQDPNYAAAHSASIQADQDKTSLLSAWNPIAQQYDQQTWSTSDI